MNDDDLRARFQALREREAAEAPPYRRPVRGAAARHWAPRLGLAAAAAGALALWLAVGRPGTPPASPERTGFDPTRWAMPTDVLLELPGHELLSELPPLPHPDPDAPAARRGSVQEIHA